VILPAAAYTEESGVFVNLEGRPQMANRAGFAPGDAKENWAILRALSAELGAALPYDSLAALRKVIVAEVPHMGAIDVVPENDWKRISLKKPAKATFKNAISDFYLTNPITRASALMAELSAGVKARNTTKVAAE
jgi:NADH-quinone oxidoreductase subunit G